MSPYLAVAGAPVAPAFAYKKKGGKNEKADSVHCCCSLNGLLLGLG